MLKKFEFFIKPIAKQVDPAFAILPILFKVIAMDSFPEFVLPLCDKPFQGSDLGHECFESDILLEVQAVIGDEFEACFDEWKDADLLIGAQFSIFVLVENPHELFEWAYLGEVGDIWLKLSKHDLEHFLGEMWACHLVFGQSQPYCLAFLGAVGVGLSLSLEFGDDGGVDRIEGVQAFGVELDGGDCVAAGRSNIGHQ